MLRMGNPLKPSKVRGENHWVCITKLTSLKSSYLLRWKNIIFIFRNKTRNHLEFNVNCFDGLAFLRIIVSGSTPVIVLNFARFFCFIDLILQTNIYMYMDLCCYTFLSYFARRENRIGDLICGSSIFY